jgi:CHAD domain-containing protein
MPAPRTRHDLLKPRLERLLRTLPGVEAREIRAVHRARVASRRLRELLPILQVEAATTRKLTRRLRKVTRGLGSVRETDVLLLLIDELHESGRYHAPALLQARAAVDRERLRLRNHLPAKSAAAELKRVARKLEAVAADLDDADDKADSATDRAWRWALDARIVRRVGAVKRAIRDAGALYLAERLHAVRIAVKKLRYGVELSVEASGVKTTPELRALKRTQELLGRLHDHQVLIDRLRQIQASLVPPDLTAWRDLDTLVTSLEQRCRRLHARYVSERSELLAICDRLVRSSGVQAVPAPRAARRAS